MAASPRISVCIPAYNRAGVLSQLLDSICAQDYRDYEIVICEDMSPQRADIARVAADYAARHPGVIRYLENARNLGYDGNLRHLIESAAGEYCVFMGNDDLLCPGALAAIVRAIDAHTNVGVVLRSYATFDDDPAHVVQEFRYFDRELIFPAGAASIGTVFRRSVVISGMTVKRDAALAVATDHYDGILLYQLYLVARILVHHDCVYLPQILTLYRNGGVPDFGNAAAERGKFVPREHTPESSLHFMRGMLDIARDVERTDGVQIYDRILSDIGNYSYPILAIQHDKPLAVFWRYYRALGRMGLDRTMPFHVYFVALVILGPRATEWLVRFVKKRLGRAPAIGDLYKGRPA